MSANMKLKPCPCCGSHALAQVTDDQINWVQCTNCRGSGPFSSLTPDVGEPTWNTRARLSDGYRVYSTKPGESLAGIACRQLNDDSRWVEIRDINAHVFPDMAHHDYYPVGTNIMLPAPPASTSAAKSNWISVNDSRPDDHKADYLIFCESGEIALSEWIYDSDLGWCFWYDPDASHWQPIPDPPAALKEK